MGSTWSSSSTAASILRPSGSLRQRSLSFQRVPVLPTAPESSLTVPRSLRATQHGQVVKTIETPIARAACASSPSVKSPQRRTTREGGHVLTPTPYGVPSPRRPGTATIGRARQDRCKPRPHPYQAHSRDTFKLLGGRSPAHRGSDGDRGCPLGTGVARPMWHTSGTAGRGRRWFGPVWSQTSACIQSVPLAPMCKELCCGQALM
jgi:hypothetical protein